MSLADGSISNESASACDLRCMSVSPTGFIFVCDLLNTFGVVRMIDPTAMTITRIVGSDGPRPGFGTNDGLDPLSVPLSEPRALALYSHGDLLIGDYSLDILRIVLFSNSTVSSYCPAGYTCPCGTPLLCSNSSEFCPANQVAPLAVTRGYFATYSTGTNISTLSRAGFSSQAPCPVGYYCIDGNLLSCPPGSFGVASMQSTPAGCKMCPTGSYGTDLAAVDASVCLRCPRGSYSALPGAALCSFCPSGSAQPAIGSSFASTCVPCPTGSTAYPGASSCFLGDSALFISPFGRLNSQRLEF